MVAGGVLNSDWPPLSTKSSLINEAKNMAVLEIEKIISSPICVT